MISRRNYFRIIILIFVLCAIFIFTMFAREKGSIYDVNMFVVEEELLPSGENRWASSGEEETVLFFGGQNKAMENTIEQWCTYTKRGLVRKDALEDYSVEQDGIPAFILLDAKNLDLGKNGAGLLPLTELGIPMFFCSLPKTEKILYSPNIREILGIKEVKDGATSIRGVRLFDGFFLGGAAEYEAADAEEAEERQDFALTVPWFLTASKTKVYMVGIMDKSQVKEEEYPCLLWRNSYKNTKVFAVCGDYMDSLAGLGILNSFVFEVRPYDIYPVVNAQNVIINNFPNFSSENEGTLQEIYSREPEMVYQGIMWPSLSAMAKTSGLRMTCLFKPQYDYTDNYFPKKDDVPFYLQQFRGVFAEAGRSLKYSEETGFKKMLEEDNKFFESMNSRYRYQVVFAENADLEKVKKETAEDGGLSKLATVSSTYEAEEPLLSYLTDGVTLQRITGDAKKHTFKDNFDLRSVQTALLYSNVLMDLHDAVWPQEEEHQWQLLYDEMSSNIYSYWRNTRLEKTTLSESDYRTRVFLNLDYFHERTGNKIVLYADNASEEAWFILRTHDEKITALTGGTYEQLEKNMYLITVKESKVEITLEPLSLKELEE